MVDVISASSVVLKGTTNTLKQRIGKQTTKQKEGTVSILRHIKDLCQHQTNVKCVVVQRSCVMTMIMLQ